MKNLLQMNDWIVVAASSDMPAFCGSASKESTEVLCINQDPHLQRTIDHFFWRGGVVKILLNLRITSDDLIAKVIQSIQRWLRGICHVADNA